MLSVITITFNNYNELVETLSSVPQSEVIQSVVINGGTCTKTVGYLKSQKHLSFTEKDNGISDAFNKGFKRSTGEFVTYLNSGDKLIDQSYYFEAIKFFSKNEDVDFIYADLKYLDSFGGPLHIKSNRPLPAMPFLHPTLIVRRKVFKKIGLFNESFKISMDLDFAYRLIKFGAKGHYMPKMVVEMDGSGISSVHSIRNYLENLKVILKNKDYSLAAFKFLIRNGFLLLVKKILIQLGGRRLLSEYRKKRFRISEINK